MSEWRNSHKHERKWNKLLVMFFPSTSFFSPNSTIIDCQSSFFCVALFVVPLTSFFRHILMWILGGVFLLTFAMLFYPVQLQKHQRQWKHEKRQKIREKFFSTLITFCWSSEKIIFSFILHIAGEKDKQNLLLLWESWGEPKEKERKLEQKKSQRKNGSRRVRLSDSWSQID